MFVNYSTGRQAGATPLAWRILDACSAWRTPDDLRTELAPHVDREVVVELLNSLADVTLLETSDAVADAHGMDAWKRWNPAAGFFHFASRRTAYVSAQSADLHRADSTTSGLSWVDRPQLGERTKLPHGSLRGPFDRTLLARRTWRRFGPGPVPRAAFARVMRAAFGITHWVTLPDGATVPLTTSPSGGSRHPLEAYVLVKRVDGIAAGLYRYVAESHELERLQPHGDAEDITAMLPMQPWFADAAFVVFIAAVFGRTQARYDAPRAYRAVLLEAGHVCQTFLLAATSLNLAPFCTMAIDDERVETIIGADGVSEAVLYAAGAGLRAGRGTTAHFPADWPPIRIRRNGIGPDGAAARQRSRR